MRGGPLPVLVLAGLVAAGCSAHRRQVREFEEGAASAYFREETLRAAAPAAPAPDLLAGLRGEAEALRARGAAWRERILRRPELEGSLDTGDPAVREALEAGPDDAATEALLRRGPLPAGSLLALVAARSPSVREARESWMAVVERLDQASWLEEVTASYRAFARDLDTRVGGGPAAPRSMDEGFLPWPSAAALRGEMAGLEAAMALQRARLAVVEALAAAEEASAAEGEAAGRAAEMEGLLPVLRTMAGVAATRYAAGKGTRAEALRVETEVARMEAAIESARGERAEAASRLNALLDREPGAPLPALDAPPLPAAPPPVEGVVARALGGNPMVAMAALAVPMARVGIRMAEAMAHPPPASATAGGPAGGMEGSGAPRARVSPWYGTEEAYLRELRHRAAAAEEAAVASRRGAEAMAVEAWTRLDAALRDLRVASGTALPLAEQAFEVSRRDYADGAAGFADHLDAWGSLVGARLDALTHRRRSLDALAALRRATGTGPTENQR